MYMYFKHIKVLWSLFHRFFSLFFFLGVNRVKLLDIWYILGFEGITSGGHSYIFTRRPLFLMQTSVYDLDVYETHLTTLYIYIKFSAFLYPSYVHVLPIAKRHSGIFLCHSILHVALHKHFVLTNGHVFFFLDNFNSRLFVYYKILLLFYLYRTGFFFFFLIWIKSLYPWPDTCTRWLVQHQDFWFKKSSSVIRDLVLDVSVYFKDYYCYL